jgi:hypothetical protein
MFFKDKSWNQPFYDVDHRPLTPAVGTLITATAVMKLFH